MLHHCDEHLEKTKPEEEKKDEKEGEKKDEKEEEKEPPKKVDDTYQSFAVLGIVLVAMGEDIGSEMALRQLNHLVCSLCIHCFRT
jgi:26S proteasome regulatory subunit N1